MGVGFINLTRSKRRDYLARVAEKRGADACEYLKAAIKQQWAKRREAA